MFFYQDFIAEAFHRRDVGTIEALFGVLVRGPDDLQVEAPDCALLIACCRGLAGDAGVMPSGLIDAINDATQAERDDALLPGSTYSAGAARAWRDIECFAPLFGEATGG